MKKLFSRILLFTLIFAMLLQPLAGAVSAKGTDKKDLDDGYIYSQINPLNGGAKTRTAKTIDQAVAPSVNLTTYTTYAAAGKYMRSQMVNRQSSISFTLKVADFDDWYQVTDDLHAAAFTHTGVPKEGDSLKWQWYSWSLSTSGSYYENGYYYLNLYYTYTYRTTAAQEKQVDTAVTNLLNQLNLDGLTDYKKIYKIYQWITANVTYDYDNYYNNPDYKIMYSTYGAIIDRTCVCQGYALLFYRLALEVGIDARLVAGDGGGPHGWNIVKLGDYYYNLDSTWDAGYGPSYWDWFLLSDANFVRHYRDDGSNFDIDYTSAAFYKKYPMDSKNYDPNQKVAAPTLKVTNVASTGKIKLSWNKVSGATKYQIVRSLDNKTWSHLAYTTNTYATNSSTVAGKTYYYKVRTVGSNGNSAYSNVVSRTCDLPQVTGLKATNVASTGKIKLSWNAVEGALKYQIVRSTDNKNWEHLTYTTSTSATNTKTNAGTTYYYKVRAIHSNSAATSAYSSVVSRTCDLAQPKAKIKLNSAGKPLIYWAAVDGAVEYKVYIYDANGNLLNTATLTNVKITHTSAVKGKTYKYRVVAIHTRSAANSAKSNLVSITSK